MKICDFISLVKERPVLYDSLHPHYKDRKEKEAMWKEISAAVKVHCEVAKNRWKSLKDCYTKYLKSTMSSGPAVYLRYHNWQWAEEMEFMKPHIKFGLIMSNIELLDNQETDDLGVQSSSDVQRCLSSSEVQGTQKTCVTPDQALTPDELADDVSEDIILPASNKRKNRLGVFKTYERPKEKKRKHSRATIVSQNTSPNNDDVVQYLESKKTDGFSATELIFLGYAKTIKTFSIRRQSKVKMKIAKVMMEAEIANYEENTSHSDQYY